MLFGSNRDVRLLTGIARELLHGIVEQEILYYKHNIEVTKTNIYRESTNKVFHTPVKLNCLILRQDQVISVAEFGPDLDRASSFAFLREDLVEANVLPEVGDILEWDKNYYEVDTVRENQLFVGKDHNYRLDENTLRFGSSVSVIVDCHLTRAERVGIIKTR